MSYDQTNPTYYQTYQQGTPFEAGAPGWTQAPWVTWGNNPNLGGRRKLATDGLSGCACANGLGNVVAISGLGADPPVPPGVTAPPLPAFPMPPPVPAWRQALGTIAGAACAYHGYKRNNESTKWAIGWALFGSTAPFLAIPIALAQGFGKPAGKAAGKDVLTANRRRAPRRHRRR